MIVFDNLTFDDIAQFCENPVDVRYNRSILTFKTLFPKLESCEALIALVSENKVIISTMAMCYIQSPENYDKTATLQ